MKAASERLTARHTVRGTEPAERDTRRRARRTHGSRHADRAPVAEKPGLARPPQRRCRGSPSPARCRFDLDSVAAAAVGRRAPAPLRWFAKSRIA